VNKPKRWMRRKEAQQQGGRHHDRLAAAAKQPRRRRRFFFVFEMINLDYLCVHLFTRMVFRALRGWDRESVNDFLNVPGKERVFF